MRSSSGMLRAPPISSRFMDSSTGAASEREMRPLRTIRVYAAAVCSWSVSILSVSVIGFRRRQSCFPLKDPASSSRRAVILSNSSFASVF